MKSHWGSGAWLFPVLGLLCAACGDGGSASDSDLDAGVLREDAVVLHTGADDELDFIHVMDAARDGDTVYLLVNFNEFPVLFVSEDAGNNWTKHPLPPSYDKVEGIEDGYPGFYSLYPWQGSLYLVVAATTVTHGASYGAVAKVDLASNDYTLRAGRFLDGRVHFSQGVGLEVSSQGQGFNDGGLEYGNVEWQQYDFATDTVNSRNSIQLAGTGLEPREWLSADGREVVALTEKTRDDGTLQLCRVSLDTSAGGSSLASACMSRARAPFEHNGSPAPIAVGSEVQWLADVGGHVFRVKLSADGDSLTPTATDLGPGSLDRTSVNTTHPMFGGFLVVPTKGESNMMVQPRPRLIRVTDDDEVEDVNLPWTPCEGGTICGYGEEGSYGTVRFVVPMDDGEVLVFHVVGKTSTGAPQVLLMTREHPTFEPASFEPVELGILPSRPELKPAPAAVQQCVRATACRYHANLATCQEYWSTVRRGPDGTDTAFAAFLAVPPGPCSAFEDVYTDRRDPARPTPCAPGCDGDWATFSCQPVRENCAARGVPCRVDALGQGFCADRELTAANCNTCDGNFAINCTDSPMPTMTDCSLSGQECHVFNDAPNPSRALCTPGACTTPEIGACVGDVYTVCWPNDPTISAERDCSRMIEGTACEQACITYSQAMLCDDELLIYGNGAASRYVDCKAIGFNDCEPIPGSDSARCIP